MPRLGTCVAAKIVLIGTSFCNMLSAGIYGASTGAYQVYEHLA